MELHTLDLKHHDFSALTKVFIIDFDNVNSSRDVIHALTKINMIKYLSLSKTGQVSKEDFESIVMFLSSYNKAKELNGRLHSLFTVVDERNSEPSYAGALQYKERLAAFAEQKTDFVDYESYYKYFSVDKEQLKTLDVDWVRHMLMLSSSRGIMQKGLTIPSKSVACIRLDDLYAITPDYSPIDGEFEHFLPPLERMMTQLCGRLARSDKKGSTVIKRNLENYVKGDKNSREKVEANRVLILFKATESQSGDRIDFFTCIRLLEKITSIKLCEQILYCSFKSSKNNKNRLENDPSYSLETNKEYIKRIETIGKRDLIYEICEHLGTINRSEFQPPSKVRIVSESPLVEEPSEEKKEISKKEISKEYLESVYRKQVYPKTVEVIERILSYGIPREYVSVNWANNRSIISGLSIDGLFRELDDISEKAGLKQMDFFTFFKDVYYENKLKKSKAKTKLSLRINISLSRSIAIPFCKEIDDSFGEQALMSFNNIIKKGIEEDFRISD